MNGDLSTGFFSYVTSTLCGPVSVGVNDVVYPSGESFTGSSTVFFFGVVTVTLQGPLVFCFGIRICTGLVSPNGIAKETRQLSSSKKTQQ